MRTPGPLFLALGLALTFHAGPQVPAAGESEDAASREFFEEQVRPLLVARCVECHGPEAQKGGLRLDSLEAMLQGGDSGPAVVPGSLEESLLVEAIHPDGLIAMPPRGKLEDAQVETLTRWVEAGAHWPGAEATGVAPKTAGAAARITDADRAFWSFQPVAPSDPPAVEDKGWGRNTIDAFIFRRLLDAGLEPSPEADRVTLIRRLTYDLTGLPPTPEEVEAFVGDPSPNAYEALVDRLLASPRYGERWGRHWLDLVRYAESDGHRADAHRPHAWRYRDYVIRSFNEDKPYHRFVREQIAGDEIDPDDPEMRVATAYYRHGPYEHNQRDVPRQWADILNDITDVTGEVFLGLSVGCARCHDHKFDPILQADYYRLQAFFTPLAWRDDLPLARAEEVADHHVRRAAWDLITADLREQIAAIERPYRAEAVRRVTALFPAETKALLARPRSELSPYEGQIYDLAVRQFDSEGGSLESRIKGEDKATRDDLKKQLATFDRLKPPDLAPAFTATDVGPVAPPTAIPGRRGAEPVEPGFLTVLTSGTVTMDGLPQAPASTGRRTALAEWLTRPDNPLSTRVIVNRVWQYHFGHGLVATSSDFGTLGEAPSHPELLDWLARRFVAEGWSLKALHRRIVQSAAYRQASVGHVSEAARLTDPENRLLWRFPPRRLDAEEIRDAMLAVSGELNLATCGGPSGEYASPRRSVYCKVLRNTRDDLIDAFDGPDNFLSTAARNLTVTPSQALLLINGEWALARARAFAARLAAAAPDDEAARIALAYSLAVSREPTAAEVSEAVAFLDRQRRLAKGAEDEALVDFCHALLNANEFLHVD